MPLHREKKIDSLLVSRYNSLLMGEKPRGLTRLESFIDVMNAIHVVQYADQCGRACPPCNVNPSQLVCTCKGSRHIGICSHAIVVNHWLESIDLNEIMMDIGGERKQKKGGYRKGVRPALEHDTVHGGGKKGKKSKTITKAITKKSTK